MKAIFFETKDWEKPYLEKELKNIGIDAKFVDVPLSMENAETAKDFDIVSTFIYSKLSKEVVEKLEKTKLITTRSTGYDHIDLEACKKKGIVVCNVPGYGTETVAEHTIALMLAISRRLIESFEGTRKGNFSIKELTGFELMGKTLGIIGAGKIGRRVAELAKAFGMRVIAFDVYKNEEESKRIGYEYVDIDTLLKESDIISLHANLTKDNYHMLDKEAFDKMKDGVIIINTARGGLIDTKALIEAIKSGKVAYAGLDVLEAEKEIKEELEVLYKDVIDKDELKKMLATHILVEMEDQLNNVLITPHNAFNSKEALHRILEITIDNIKNFIEGRPMNMVNE